ncbi:MAG TPA: class I SAM-dependent methyltransferase [Marmoricola sp.]|nr:class I SAM-dependent methyltransferase [Marmoricola sp.]
MSVTAVRREKAAEVTVDERGLRLPSSARGVVTVAFDGRYVWSFQPERDAEGTHKECVPWPASLRPHLRGTTHLTVTQLANGTDAEVTWLDDEVRFGTHQQRIRLEDPQGHPLAVNKVGNLTRVFGETGDDTKREILTSVARILEDLRTHGGVEAILNYGCLLGAIRTGEMIGTDCDADLTYLSEQTSPIAVILESYRLERAMAAHGWKTVRMSGGDFKVMLRLDDGRTCHVDVFVGFYAEDTYYQLGNRSGHLTKEAIVPARPVVLEGVELPGPADPEAMLAFVYGPTWRTPDPAFRFTDPPAGVRRLDGWLRGQRDHLPRWNAFFRGHEASEVPEKHSDFAMWVRERIASSDDLVADLGCGTGRDSAYFAAAGHRVMGYDISPEARQRAQRRLRAHNPRATVRRLMLGELRTALLVGCEVALSRGRPQLYARNLLGALDRDERLNLWRLARIALAGRGGSIFVEAPAHLSWARLPHPDLPVPLRRVDVDEIVRELESYGGRVVERVEGPGTDLFDRPDPWTVRLHVTFEPTLPTPKPAPIAQGDPVPETQTRSRIRRAVARRAEVTTRLDELESAVHENRRLHRQVAELTDVVAELLVPLAESDDEATQAVLKRYRAMI